MKEKKSIYYVKYQNNNDSKLVKTEIILMPILVIAPIVVGLLLINDWYNRDLILNELDLFAELILGLIIIFGNILFDIFFIKSLKDYKKNNSKN